MKKETNWEKIGVYITVISLVFALGAKLNQLSERVSKLEVKKEMAEIHARLNTLEEKNR